MSVEVISQGHIFRPKRVLARIQEILAEDLAKKAAKASTDGPNPDGDDADVDDGESNLSEDLDPISSLYPPFCFRSLHDLESLWWLIVFLLIRWDADQEPQGQPDAKEEKRRVDLEDKCTLMFSDSFDHMRTIKDDGYFYTLLVLLSLRMQRAGLVLEELREQLVSRYTESEEYPDSLAKPVTEGLYDAFAKTFAS